MTAATTINAKKKHIHDGKKILTCIKKINTMTLLFHVVLVADLSR